MDGLDALLALADTSSQNFGEVQLDAGHKADIGKLVNIFNMILDEFTAIESIYVTPTTIMESDLSEVGQITFIVRINMDVTDDEYNYYAAEFAGLVDSYISDEYPYFSGKYMLSEIAYGSDIGRQSYMVLAHRKKLVPWQITLMNNELLALNILLQNKDFVIDIPNTWELDVAKTILIHVRDINAVMELYKHMSMSESIYGIKFVQPGSNDLYSYIPVIGMNDVPYGLPYTRIEHAHLDFQRLEELLKPEDG